MADAATEVTADAGAPEPPRMGSPEHRAAVIERVAAARETGEEGTAPAAETEVAKPDTPEDGQTAPAPTDDGQPAAPAGEGAPAPDESEPDWTDPEARAAYLKDRDDAAEKQRKESLENQKRSIEGQNRGDREFAAQQRLIAELDKLDPMERQERLADEPDEAILWAQHQKTNDQTMQAAGNRYFIDSMVPLLRTTLGALDGMPDFDEFFGDPEKAATAQGLEGGLYEWLATTAMEAGATDAVAKFKESAEFKRLLTETAENAVKDGLPSMGAPPPSSERRPSGPGQAAESDNPRVRAMRNAAKTAGVDLNEDALTEMERNSRGRRRTVGAAS